MPVVVGISLGDPSGIGPEILAKALASPKVRKAIVPLVFGDPSAQTDFPALRRLGSWTRGAPLRQPSFCAVSALAERDRRPGKPTKAGGKAQLEYVLATIAAAKAGVIQAICTAPVSKEQITRAGIPFMGHTEVLAEAFGTEVMMMMDGPLLRVALATNHLPITQVASALNADKLAGQLVLMSRSLEPALGRKPRIAVCGLNPHAGEGGLLGTEEARAIIPAIRQAKRRGVDCEGPLPADGLFARVGRMPYDAVLAMYHDQGLIPVKALDFERTVNVTLGLPVPRTSPDHGVAYDIAGQGKASAVPMISALLKAAELAGA